MLNNVNIVGRLTHDPEKRVTTSGKTVCDFAIAVKKPYKAAEGEADSDFFRIVAWNDQAEFVTNYLGKGRMVSITGRLATRKYQTATGQLKEIVEIVATKIEALDRPKTEAPARPYTPLLRASQVA